MLTNPWHLGQSKSFPFYSTSANNILILINPRNIRESIFFPEFLTRTESLLSGNICLMIFPNQFTICLNTLVKVAQAWQTSKGKSEHGFYVDILTKKPNTQRF